MSILVANLLLSLVHTSGIAATRKHAKNLTE